MTTHPSDLADLGGDALSPEQRLTRDTARQVVHDRVVPHIAASEADESFPHAIVPPLAEAGLLGGTIPEKYAGSGMDHLTHALVIEEVSRAWQVLGSLVAMASGPVGRALLQYGSEEQKQKWLAPMARGEALAGYALTEPSSGTDAAAIMTRARPVDGGYSINGSKTWIDWASDGHFFLTFARTDPHSTGATGVTAFIVERGTQGFHTSAIEGKLGMRALTVGELFFDDCRVGIDNRIGEEGEGFEVAMVALEEARLGVAARLCGGLAACLDLSVSYANQRELFGRHLGDFQMTKSKLADMTVALDAARSLTWRAARLKDAGEPASRAVLTAKLYAQEAYMRVSRDAVQLFGAYGMSDEYEVNRHFRDAKVSEVTGGTNEILRLLIADQVLGRRSGR